MSSSAKSFFDNFTTVRAILTGVVRWNCYSYHAKNFTKILNPFTKQRPGSIMYRFSQAVIFDHIPHHQIFIRHEVVRPHHAPCRLSSKVFTLAIYFEVFTRKFISKLNSVLRTFFSLRQTALQPFQRLLALAKMPRIGDCFPVTICIEVVQSHINTNSFTRWFSQLSSVLVDTKLAIIAICTTDNPYPQKMFKLVEMQITGSPELKGSRFEPD